MGVSDVTAMSSKSDVTTAKIPPSDVTTMIPTSDVKKIDSVIPSSDVPILDIPSRDGTTDIIMAHLKHVGHFDYMTDDVGIYLEKLEQYFLSNNINDKHKQVRFYSIFF